MAPARRPLVRTRPLLTRRRAGSLVIRVLVSLPILAKGAPAPCAHAEGGDPWPTVAAATRDLETAADALPGLLAGPLAGGDWSAHASSLVLYTADTSNRDAAAKRWADGLDAAAARLDSAGFVLGDDSETNLVHVRPPDGPLLVVASADGSTILLREPVLEPPPDSPVLPKRSDGPALARDVVRLADEALVEARTFAARRARDAGPGSPTNALARRAVTRITWPDGSPAWLKEAIVAWLEEVAYPKMIAVPIHVCGGAKGKSFGAAALFDPKATPTTSQARVLGRVFAALAADRKDVRDVVAKVAASADHGVRALADAFQQDPIAVLAKVLESIPAEPGSQCNAEGTTPCPACRGGGRFEIACPACHALAGVACPACKGDSSCRSPHCVEGDQLFWAAKPTACGLCRGRGWCICLSCENVGRVLCKACSGGRVTWSCLVCAGKGRVPCREAGLAPTPVTACPICRAGSATAACPGCGGAGNAGCRTCFGTLHKMCTECFGRGCTKCNSLGFWACGDCKNGRVPCSCGGKGTVRLEPERCLACEATGSARTAARAWRRLASARAGLPNDELQKNSQMLTAAIRFMFSSMDSETGEFCLREPRQKRESPAGALKSATLYSNALVLGSLFAAGIGPLDPRLTRAWSKLRADAEGIVEGTLEHRPGLQATTQVLRALVAARDPSDAPLIAGIVKKLSKAQRPSGFWADTLDSKEPGDAYTALYALEALWLARRGGAAVSGEVWSRALTASAKLSGEISKSKSKSGFLSATTVSSSAALAAIAKAGASNGAPSLDDVRNLTNVKQALAWLDRHFDLGAEPLVNGGALRTLDTDAAFAAYLYALQRLCQLLSIDTIGGERWHRAGARRLRELQLPDGSFEELGFGRLNGAVRTTDSAILFLVRATPPLTETGSSATDDR